MIARWAAFQSRRWSGSFLQLSPRSSRPCAFHGRRGRPRRPEPGVDVADHDGRAAAGDRFRLGNLDLPHVPLERRERVLARGRVRELGLLAVAVALAVTGLAWATGWSDLATPATRASCCMAASNVSFRDRATTTPIAS